MQAGSPPIPMPHLTLHTSHTSGESFLRKVPGLHQHFLSTVLLHGLISRSSEDKRYCFQFPSSPKLQPFSSTQFTK